MAKEKRCALQHEVTRDGPWLIRTYAGHSTAAASMPSTAATSPRGRRASPLPSIYRPRRAMTPTTRWRRGGGKVGVPVSHLGDMETLFEGSLERMNTSMTINATAPWLLALYVACAERQGVARKVLQGTTQNDIFKEYLSRGTYIFPPQPSLRLIGDVIAFTLAEIPKWNPINVCSYHLQEAGATAEQELAYALATAITVLDFVRDGGQVDPDAFPRVVGRISFFVNAGCASSVNSARCAPSPSFDEICRERYGITEEKYRRFRYGVQVNSLGLTEQQPENNVYRILLEMLAVVLSKKARARAVQLPPGTKPWACPVPGISNGLCGYSRSLL